MNNNKLDIYNSLNRINYSVYKKNTPFDLYNTINLTYNNIELQYIKDKNYFVTIDKNIKKDDRHNEQQYNRPSRQHSPKRHNNYKKYNGGLTHNAIYIYY